MMTRGISLYLFCDDPAVGIAMSRVINVLCFETTKVKSESAFSVCSCACVHVSDQKFCIPKFWLWSGAVIFEL